MSFMSISQCVDSLSFNRRVTSCIAQEQKARGEPAVPEPLLPELRWAVATASDVEAAYASALASGNPDPGGDPAVISDAMILGNVQASWPQDVASPP